MAYRSSVTKPTGISPFYVLYGRQMNLGIDLTLINEFEKSADIQKYVSDLLPKLKLTHEIVQQNLKDSNVFSKAHYVKNSKEFNFDLGSKVLLFDATTKKGECAKLKRRWRGPFLITDKSDDNLLYKLRHRITVKELKPFIHINRLKLFNEERNKFYTRHNMLVPDNNVDKQQSTADTAKSW